MNNCVDTILFGQVCDACDGGAIFKIVAFFLKLISAGVLVLAVIGIIICGVMIMSAGSSPDRVAKGKRRLIEIIVGIIIYALLFTIANFIIPGGVVTSSLDTTTTSCPEVKPPSGGGEDDPPGGGENPPTGEGEYPWATLEGTPSAGVIKCPHNKDYTYSVNSESASGSYDKWFQSQAQSCPFTSVKYTKTADDQACAPGNTMHYAKVKNSKRKSGGVQQEEMGPFCIVNSKIDVSEYQRYLVENYIVQDNKVCTTSGECMEGKESAPSGMNEHNSCNYWSYTISSNLNNGEVVSNDALASKFGIAFHAAYHRTTKYGNRQATWGGRSLYIYDDQLTGVQLNPGASMPLPRGTHVDGMKPILTNLRAGKAVAVYTNNGQGKQHFLTAVGFTKDCAIGSTATCNFDDIVFLNSTWGGAIQVKYGSLSGFVTSGANSSWVCDETDCKRK